MAGIYSAFALYLVKFSRAELWEGVHRPGKHYAVLCKGFEYLRNLVFSGVWTSETSRRGHLFSAPHQIHFHLSFSSYLQQLTRVTFPPTRSSTDNWGAFCFQEHACLKKKDRVFITELELSWNLWKSPCFCLFSSLGLHSRAPVHEILSLHGPSF